jgi:betaine-aldehyde dehydrogenase
MATTMGPLISEAQRERVLGFIRSGVEEGAKLLLGGGPPKGNPALDGGFFVEPTVFVDVKPTMRIAREEIFGPVVSVFKWENEDEVFAAANDTEYGLTASIWTNDIKRAQRAVRKVEAGYVWVNQVGRHYLGVPFGGVKQSGVGREESVEELLEFTQLKSVNMAL